MHKKVTIITQLGQNKILKIYAELKMQGAHILFFYIFNIIKNKTSISKHLARFSSIKQHLTDCKMFQLHR